MKKMLTTAAFALGMSVSVANASPINIGGVVWDPAISFDATIASGSGAETELGSGFLSNPLAIAGYGLISAINGSAAFCGSCELTYEFGGFTTTGPVPTGTDGSGNPTFDTVFTGGWLNLYVDSSADFNLASLGSAIDGDLWLSLTAREISGATLSGGIVVNAISGLITSGSGDGFFDVTAAVGTMRGDAGAIIGTSGAANPNFDTNTQPSVTDFTFSSTFFDFANNNPNGGFGLATTNQLTGDSIPEPGMLGLLGLGLVGFGLMARRRRS